MAHTPTKPDIVVLHGPHAELICRLTDDAASIVYRDAHYHANLDADALELQETPVGTLLTGELAAVPDQHTITLTLLLPAIHLGADGEDAPVATQAIITVHRTSIGGPDLLAGALQSYTFVPLQGIASASAPRSQCADWSAGYVADRRHRLILRVTGRCTFPTSGYTVALRPHVPSGINPRDLLLDLVVTSPTGPVLDQVTEMPVEYAAPSNGFHTTVTILPDGPTLKIRPAK